MDVEVSNNQLYKLMQSLMEKSAKIENQNNDIKEELKNEIRSVKRDLKKELDKINEENTQLKEENKILRERINTLEKKSKKYNLIFYGIEENDTELVDIQYLLEKINNTLKIDCRLGDLRDIFRFGKKGNQDCRPLLVEFVNCKLKVEILKNATKFKGTKIYVSQDYTTEEYDKQKFLRSQQKVARENGKDAYIKSNALIVNGQKYTYEELKQKSAQENEKSSKENIVNEKEIEDNTDKKTDKTNTSSNENPKDKEQFSKQTEKKRKQLTAEPEDENLLKKKTRQTRQNSSS